MRIFTLFAACVLAACATLHAAEDSSPGFSISNQFVAKSGGKVSGSIGACLMDRGDKPVVAFGLEKSPDADAKYTFFVLFKTGGKKFRGSGTGSEITSDGKTSTWKTKLSFGEMELPIHTVSTRDVATNKTTVSKLVIGDKEITEKGPKVVLVDVTGEKPTYRLVQVELPKSAPDLADEEEKTWPAALDAAIKELKEKSEEVRRGVD
jgi:hypothetical protein